MDINMDIEYHRENKRVYLAGPIEGRNNGEIRTWREELGYMLTLCGFSVYSPLRFCSLDNGSIPSIEDEEGNPFSKRLVLERDLDDLELCDTVIANLHGIDEVTSIGTLMELGVALEKKKRVIIFNLPEKFREHPFLFRFTNVEMGNLWEFENKKPHMFSFGGYKKGSASLERKVTFADGILCRVAYTCCNTYPYKHGINVPIIHY